MKTKTINYLTTALLTAAIMLIDANVCTSKMVEVQDGPIVIIPKPTHPEEEPRSPIYNPFSAFLEDDYVILNSSVSYGIIDVELVSTTGDFYQTVFDTEDGSILVPISGNSGCYTITLITTSGQVYEGQFIV